MPFDQFTRELIDPPTPESRGYIEGIRWRGSVSAAQKVELQFAQSISQSFLGINLKCASCHDSFNDRWTLDEAYGLAAIYAEQTLDVHQCDKPVGRQATPGWLFPELGTIDASAPREVRLRQLAALMTHPENGRFTRTIVNRLWYRLMGHGIVHPLDAMRTKPWNEDLLDYLAMHLVDHNYDLKSVLQLIATSHAYQSRSDALDKQHSDQPRWHHAPRAKRMTAEQFLDSIWQITGDAPEMFEAPVIRGRIDEESQKSLHLQGRWISINADESARAEKKPVVFRREFKLKDRVLQGAAVIACDAPFQLYVNSFLVLRGNGSREPFARELHTDLANKKMHVFNKGMDSFVVIVTPNDAAERVPQLYFEARLKLDTDEELRISSDDQWKGVWENPSLREGLVTGIPGDMQPVSVGPPIEQSDPDIVAVARHRLAVAVPDSMPMVRASLMKNDFFMKSLGRPARDQIVAMRPQELATLEAIHLSNGPEFSATLTRGADRLLTRFPDDRKALIDYVYRFALSRESTEAERSIIQTSLGDRPSPRSVADFLWTIFLSPEFLFVR
jgi:hypothetical protein